ncbi:MAG: class I adenylate-forming enzyme family protein [Actinomycetota bacterium]
MPATGTGELVALKLPRPALSDGLERVWETGGTALPLDPHLPESALRALLTRFRPDRLVTEEGVDRLPGALPVDPEVAVVLATSGTTGAPKGVELGWAALDAAARITNDAVGARDGDRWLCCLPPWQVGGFMTLVRSRTLGARAVVHGRFDPDEIGSDAATGFVSVVPTMLTRLLASDVDLTRFQTILVGGDRADAAPIEQARAAGAHVITTYGMTETCGGVVYDGAPLPEVHVSLTPDGVIAIAAPTLMHGYRLDHDSTRRALVDGRFITNDRGEIDDDGRLVVLGRVDDVIVSGGHKVAPRRVEEALAEHPAVRRVSIEGVADPELGRRTVARISLHEGARAPSLEEVRAFVAERLGAHHAPRQLIVERDDP